MLTKTITVDLDGFLFLNTEGAYDKSLPITSNIEFTNHLYDQGWSVLILSTRGVFTGIDWSMHTITQLSKHSIKYSALYNAKKNLGSFVLINGYPVPDDISKINRSHSAS